jgi:hypothetical protein
MRRTFLIGAHATRNFSEAVFKGLRDDLPAVEARTAPTRAHRSGKGRGHVTSKGPETRASVLGPEPIRRCLAAGVGGCAPANAREGEGVTRARDALALPEGDQAVSTDVRALTKRLRQP